MMRTDPFPVLTYKNMIATAVVGQVVETAVRLRDASPVILGDPSNAFAAAFVTLAENREFFEALAYSFVQVSKAIGAEPDDLFGYDR